MEPSKKIQALIPAEEADALARMCEELPNSMVNILRLSICLYADRVQYPWPVNFKYLEKLIGPRNQK